MKIDKLNVYSGNPPSGVDNEYPTNDLALRSPFFWLINGVRNTGKSHLLSKYLEQAKRDKTYNRIYLISPTFLSNYAYFGQYLLPEDAHEPTKEAISEILAKIEEEKVLWDTYVEEMELYKLYKKTMNDDKNVDADLIIKLSNLGYLSTSKVPEKPKWIYPVAEPPKSLLIFDDVMNTPALCVAGGFNRLAIMSRHISPLQKTFTYPNGKTRSACGVSCVILTQSYRAGSNMGCGRLVREQLSHFTTFQNKQAAQRQAIKDELASSVDEDLYQQAYDYATSEKYGNLTVDFKPKMKSLTFRKNLNEAIVFDELKD